MIVALSATGIGLVPVQVMAAGTYGMNDYPNSNAVDCSAQYGSYSWCIGGSWLSPRRFAYRNCTDFVAWRLGITYGSLAFPGGDGNARGWKQGAINSGYQTSSTPVVGAVAWWGTEVGGGFGHVAVVIQVNADGTAKIEQYNQAGTGQYSIQDHVTADAYLYIGVTSSNPGDPSGSGASNGGSTLRGTASGRCIDITGAGTANGTRPQLYDCNPGTAQQRWIFDYGQLKVYGSYNKCLDADSNSGGVNGTIIQIFDCNGGANQRWIFPVGGTIRSAAYGRCLDAAGAGTANGTQLQLWDCHGGTNQAWTGGPTPNGGGAISSVASGRCIDIPGASITPGARPQLYDCNGGSQQQWRLIGTQLQVYFDKCLDVTGAGTANGSTVQLYYCNGAQWQQWTLAADGTIRSQYSGRCLDAAGGGTTNGTLLQIWDCNDAPWQKWIKGSPV